MLDLDVEILLGFLESIEAETLAIDLLTKSTTTSGKGTSLATNKAMEVIGDPDSAFEGLLRRGEVTLSELAPYERFFSLPPFAAWIARACSKYFISEMSTLAQAMLEYVRSSLTFLSPSGSLSIHAAHIALSKFLTQCDAAGAEFCNRELFLGVAAKFELIGVGHSAEMDAALDAMLELRQPFRSSESAPREAVIALYDIIGTLADAEARRQSLRTPGLAPSHRTALAIAGGETYLGHDLAGSDDLRVAFVRAPPPVCHVCGKAGLAGVLFLPCCMILTKDAIRCGSCGCLNLASQFNRTGCRARVTLPMCAPADGDMGARPGLGSTVLTALQASELERFYMRVKAMRDRQALLRSSLPASVHSVCFLEGDLGPSVTPSDLPVPGQASRRSFCMHRRHLWLFQFLLLRPTTARAGNG